jgi:hypothetical protein
MKKLVLSIVLAVLSIGFVAAQTKQADIKFKQTTYNFGKFSENHPVVSCDFEFTNTGDAPLIIHQAIASCGCTVPQYPKQPIMPGKTGVIKVTYNGTGRVPGALHKSVTLRTNGKTEIIRLYIEGEMTPKD